MAYYQKRRVQGEFDDVVQRTIDALQDEGFGILADIDVQATLTEKLGLDSYRRYRILGACNPPLAEQGLAAEPDLGVLLPCNVAVYEDGDEVVVSAVDPDALLGPAENPDLDPIAADVRERFDRVLDEIGA